MHLSIRFKYDYEILVGLVFFFLNIFFFSKNKEEKILLSFSVIRS